MKTRKSWRTLISLRWEKSLHYSKQQRRSILTGLVELCTRKKTISQKLCVCWILLFSSQIETENKDVQRSAFVRKFLMIHSLFKARRSCWQRIYKGTELVTVQRLACACTDAAPISVKNDYKRRNFSKQQRLINKRLKQFPGWNCQRNSEIFFFSLSLDEIRHWGAKEEEKFRIANEKITICKQWPVTFIQECSPSGLTNSGRVHNFPGIATEWTALVSHLGYKNRTRRWCTAQSPKWQTITEPPVCFTRTSKKFILANKPVKLS